MYKSDFQSLSTVAIKLPVSFFSPRGGFYLCNPFNLSFLTDVEYQRAVKARLKKSGAGRSREDVQSVVTYFYVFASEFAMSV